MDITTKKCDHNRTVEPTESYVYPCSKYDGGYGSFEENEAKGGGEALEEAANRKVGRRSTPKVTVAVRTGIKENQNEPWKAPVWPGDGLSSLSK